MCVHTKSANGKGFRRDMRQKKADIFAVFSKSGPKKMSVYTYICPVWRPFQHEIWAGLGMKCFVKEAGQDRLRFTAGLLIGGVLIYGFHLTRPVIF